MKISMFNFGVISPKILEPKNLDFNVTILRFYNTNIFKL